VKVGRYPFIANGKAIALGDVNGFVKTVLDAKTGELLGAHMIGPEVTEMIQGYTIGKTLETTEVELCKPFSRTRPCRNDARIDILMPMVARSTSDVMSNVKPLHRNVRVSRSRLGCG